MNVVTLSLVTLRDSLVLLMGASGSVAEIAVAYFTGCREQIVGDSGYAPYVVCPPLGGCHDHWT